MNTPVLGNILYISRAFNNYSRQMTPEGELRPGEALFINYIYHNEGCTQDRIVRFSGMDKTTVAHRLARLETLGYIERKEDSADGRKRLCFLTEKGLEAFPLIHEQYVSFKDSVLSPLSEEELAVLEKLTSRLKENAEKLIEE